MSIYQAPDGATESAPLAATPGPKFPAGARALIVDDMAENRSMLALCCDRFGVSHASAQSGREALEAASTSWFDVILMDIFMPGMDGIAATRAIRALPGPICAVPIIAVTTAASPGAILRYLDCGMTDVVPKPVNPARLAEAMSGALAQARRDMRAARASTAAARSAARLRA